MGTGGNQIRRLRSNDICMFPSNGLTNPTDIPSPLRVDLFFEKSRSGFRVHRGRFTKSLTLPPKSQPHPGLLYVIYVIACRFSENPLLTCHESTFLARARVHLAQSLAKKDRLVHFLAGSTLLAYYLLISGRFLEGAHEVGGTVSVYHLCFLMVLSRYPLLRDLQWCATCTRFLVPFGHRHHYFEKTLFRLEYRLEFITPHFFLHL